MAIENLDILTSKDYEIDVDDRLEDPRSAPRYKYYKDESVQVTLSTENGRVIGRCLDLSHTGLSMAFTPNRYINLTEGTVVSIQVSSHQTRSYWLDAKVIFIDSFSPGEDSEIKIGLAIKGQGLSNTMIASKRGVPLIELPEFYQPVASAQDPLFSRGLILVKITGISHSGSVVKVRANSLPIIPGLNMQLSVSLPTNVQINFLCEVIQIRHLDSEFFEVDLSFREPKANELASIAEYLLIANPDCSVSSLKDAGFLVEGTKNSFRLSYCNTERDWEAVLRLRLEAYKKVGKFLDKDNPREMIDELDRFSRQIICKSGSEVVGAMRTVFVNKDPNRSEHLKLGIHIPDDFFKHEFIEISRACTDTEYRGADVLPLLFGKALEICMQAGQKYVFANCNSDLWPLYAKIGFKKLGKQFEAFGRDDCQLIFLDAQKVFVGVNVNPLLWNQYFLETVEHIQKKPSRQVSKKLKLASKVASTLHSGLKNRILMIRRERKNARRKKREFQ